MIFDDVPGDAPAEDKPAEGAAPAGDDEKPAEGAAPAGDDEKPAEGAPAGDAPAS